MLDTNEHEWERMETNFDAGINRKVITYYFWKTALC